MFHFPSSNQNNSLEKQKKFPDFVFLIFNSCNYILALLGHINDPRKTSSSTFPGLKFQKSRTKFPWKRSYDPGSRTLNYLPLSFHFFFFSFFFLSDRPTYVHKRQGDRKRNISWIWPNYIQKLLWHINHPCKMSSSTFWSDKISVENLRAGEAMIPAPVLQIVYHFPFFTWLTDPLSQERGR